MTAMKRTFDKEPLVVSFSGGQSDLFDEDLEDDEV
ncbi:phosphoadenosine phosphosulfate reductase family protein [Salmonella phage ZCSE8]|nr:phosphoadenosine phosphosulfate reductase family protein [Salmonella phage ZCSE8]